MNIKIPLFFLVSILVISALAPFISPYDPIKIDMNSRLEAPSSEHLLGTDSLGRDTFSRVLHGGRQSIILAFFATLFSMTIGIFIGFFSGYYGGWIDNIITSISNIFMGLPGVSIMIAIVGVLGPSMKSLLIAIVINSWVSFSRLVRAEVMNIKNEYFIENLKNIGAKDIYILFYHILPNLSDSLIIVFVSKIGGVILSVASLSYLGLGLSPPEPDWAIMISDARQYFRSNPYLVISPGVCIVIFVWSVHSIGDTIRDTLDIRGGINDNL
jgi:peptide/nickel transport system permease protein